MRKRYLLNIFFFLVLLNVLPPLNVTSVSAATENITVNSVSASVSGSTFYYSIPFSISSTTSITWDHSNTDPVCVVDTGRCTASVVGTLHYRQSGTSTYTNVGLGSLSVGSGTHTYSFSSISVGPLSKTGGNTFYYYVSASATVVNGPNLISSSSGNSPTYSLPLTADTTAPTISSVTLNPSTPLNNRPVTVTATISDSQTGVSSYSLSYFVDGAGQGTVIFSRTSGNQYSGTYSGTIPGESSSSTVVYIIRATDVAGNPSSYSNSYTPYSDTTPPTIASFGTVPQTGLITNETQVKFYASASDAFGIAGVTVSYYYQNTWTNLAMPYSSSAGRYESAYISFYFPPGSNISYTISATDTSANTRTVSSFFEVFGTAIPNPSFESGTTSTSTNDWALTRGSTYDPIAGINRGPPGNDGYSPYFVSNPTSDGKWAVTVMGPYVSDSQNVISSPSLNVPLYNGPIVNTYLGIGGTYSQWGTLSWTGVRLLISNGATTYAIVYATHLGANLYSGEKLQNSVYTQNYMTYFYKISVPNLNTLYLYQIPVQSIFEQQFGSSGGFSIVNIQVVGQGQVNYGQSGYIIADSFDVQYGPVISNVYTSPVSTSIDDTSYVNVYATITSSVSLDSLNQILSYYYNSAWKNVSMAYTGSNNLWKSASIGTFIKGSTVQYKIYSKDSAGNWASSKSSSFYVKDSDTLPPTISDPVVSPSSPNEIQQFSISSTITDGSGVSSAVLYYSINNGVFTPVTMSNPSSSTYTSTFGPYPTLTNFSYWIKATDNSLNSNVAIKDNNGGYYNFTIGSSDVYPPTISDVGNNQPTDATAAYVSATVSDASTGGSGIAWVSVVWRVNSGSWTTYTISLANNGTNGYSFRLPQSGLFTSGNVIEYYIRASDNSYNHNIAQDDNSGNYFTFTVGSSDVTPPSYSNLAYSPAKPNGSDIITVSVNLTDPSGIASATLTYNVNGGSSTTLSLTNTYGTGYSVVMGSFNDGDVVSWYISAVDGSLNKNGRMIAGPTINIGSADTIPPSIQGIIVNPLGTITDIQTFTITATVSDASGIAYVNIGYSINGGSITWSNMTTTDGANFVSQFGPYTAGDVFAYTVHVVDNSTNHNSRDQSGYFTIASSDTTPPTIYSVNYPTNPTDLNNIAISVTVYDSNGIKNVSLVYRINSTNYQTVLMSFSGYSGTYSIYGYNLGTFAPSTRVEFFINAMDNSTNYNTVRYPASTTIVLNIKDSDTTPPTIQNPVYLTNPTEQTDLVVQTNVTDQNGLYSVLLYLSTDGSTFTSYSMSLVSGNTYSYDLGMFTKGTTLWFYIQATDNSLNHNVGTNDNNSNYYEVFISDSDVTPPIISNIQNNPTNPAYNDSISVSATVTDSQSGIANVTLYYEVNASGTWIAKNMINNSNIYQYNLGMFTTGTAIQYYIVSFDTSLNQNKVINDNNTNYFIITVIDPYSPTLSSVNDKTIEIGSSTGTLSWTASDQNPGSYQIFIDSVLYQSGLWQNGVPIQTSFTPTIAKQYNITIVVFDSTRNRALDSLTVNVTPNTTTTSSIISTTPKSKSLENSTSISKSSPGFSAFIGVLSIIMSTGMLMYNRRRKNS